MVEKLPLSWPIRWPKTALVVIAIITLAALAAVSRFHADTSFENLLPGADPAARAMVHALNDFAAVDEMLVLVSLPPDGVHGMAPGITHVIAPDTVPDAPADPERLEQFANRFERSVKRDPQADALIASVTDRTDAQAQEFFQKVVAPAGLFYLDDASFAAALARLRRPAMDAILKRNEALLAAPGPAAGALAATLLQDPLHLHDFLIAQFAGHQPLQMSTSAGLLLSHDRRHLLIRVAGKRPVSDLAYSKSITQAVNRVIATAKPGLLQIDVTGGYAIAAASEKAIRHDMTSSVTGSVILLQVLFLLAYRRPVRFFLLAFIPVGLGILWGFGVRALLDPSLSPTAAVVGGVLAGLGIDYTIQYLSNYQARRGVGETPQAAAIAASSAMGGTILAAWGTSVIGFGVVGFSSIAALRDFALVGSLGLLGALLATFAVLPAVLVLSDRDTAASRLRWNVYPLLRWIARRRAIALGVIAASLAAALVVVAWPGVRLPMESDLTSMHPRPNPPLDAEAKVARVMGVSPGSILVYLSADTGADLVRLSHEVQARLDTPAARRAGITGSFGLADLLPDPAAAATRAKAISPAQADQIVADFRAAVAASDFDSASYEPYAIFLHLLLTRTQWPTIRDLVSYPQLAKSTISRAMLNGSQSAKRESITLLFTDRSLDDRADRVAVVDGARQALSGVQGATLTGLSVVGLDAETIVSHQAPRMLVISATLIGLIILFHFRSVRDAGLAFAPTLFSLLLLAAIARLTAQSLNMMNLLVIPLLMGIDTDYGIFLVGLTRHARRPHGEPAPRAIAGSEMAASFYALGVSAASAALGFGSLVFTSVPAIRSLGWAMGVGVTICFAATLLYRVPLLLRQSE